MAIVMFIIIENKLLMMMMSLNTYNGWQLHIMLRVTVANLKFYTEKTIANFRRQLETAHAAQNCTVLLHMSCKENITKRKFCTGQLFLRLYSI